MNQHVTSAILIFVSLCSCALAGEVYPGKTWASKTPAEVGMDAAKLKAFKEYVGGRGCVIRHGYMVYSWGDAGKRADVASAMKPWYSHFLFKAVEEGKLKSVDELVCEYEPCLNSINESLGFKDRNIRWRHLANQTACYGLEEQPGKAFVYNDWQMALFFDSLFLKVYGSSHEKVDEEVLHPLLTDPMQCEDNPTFMAFGLSDRPGRLAISPRDFARFGLLYLRKGNWKGKQIISPGHAEMAVTSPLPNTLPRTAGKAAEMIPGQRSVGGKSIPDNQSDHGGSYSWLWWMNGVNQNGNRHWPDAPLDTFGAFGHGGPRVMAVIPSLDLVVSWNDAKINSIDMENEAFKLLKESVVDANPMQGQIVADPKHPQRLVRRDEKPLFMCGPGDPEDFLYRGKLNPVGTRDGDQTALIRKLASTGANCIYLMAVRSHGGDGDSTHNPFMDNDPAKGLNPKVLDQWEQWFAEMDRNNIVIYFFIYDDGARIWNTGDKVGDEEREFIRTLVDRFEHHKNLIWCIAEEYREAYTPKRIRSLAALIREADDYDHPIAVHKNKGLDFSEFADDPNIDQFAVQYNVPTTSELHDGLVKAWKDASGKFSLNMAEAAGFGTGAEARHKMWACAMGGAYVMILGMDIASTPISDLEDCGNLVRFMESTDFSEMSPHDELKLGATEYVLAKPGYSYIAYTSNAAGLVGLKEMAAGTYEFRWLDCATGEMVIQPHVEVRKGDQSWPKPRSIGGELAVHIRRVR